MKTKIIHLKTKTLCPLQVYTVQVPGACRSQYDVMKMSSTVQRSSHFLNSHLQYLCIPGFLFKTSCTAEHKTPSLSAITLILVLLSMLTMSLTKSLMEQVTNAGWLLLKLSSIDSLVLLKRECHL